MSKVGAEEFTKSLTGYDELAITKAFKQEWTDLAVKRPATLTRALAFVMKRREGLSDEDAYKAAMAMTIGEATDQFAPVDALGEVDDEGKDD